MKKINKRWYIFTLLAIIAILIFMVTYNHAIFTAGMRARAINSGNGGIEIAAQDFESYLLTGKNVVETTAVAIEYMMGKGATAEEIEQFLAYESESYKENNDSDFTGIYGFFNGTYIDGMGWTPNEDYDPKSRNWYIAAVAANGEPAIVSPYLNMQTNTYMISISQLLSDGESVLSLDIGLDYLQQVTEGVSLNSIGYGFAVDRNGIVIAHDDINERGKNYLADNSEMRAIVDRIYKENTDWFEHDLNGEKVIVFSESVMDDWSMVMVADNAGLFADSQATLVRNIIVCIIISVLIIVFFVITFIKIDKSIKLEKKINSQIDEMNKKIIRALVKTIDAKDRYTNGHSLRVAEYSREIARRMNKSEKELEEIYYAGLLHDVGKIRVPATIINKPGKLTDEEYEQVKIHPLTSYHILKDIYEDKTISMGAKFHHERYDGRGYPNSLEGENIPEIARIISVADTYDAMASNRSYRKALPQDVVRSEIEKGKGTQFDPEIAEIMLQMIDEDETYSLSEPKSVVKSVLVIDDELLNIKLIEHIMSDEPMYEIIGASSGTEALEILEKREINLILLDVVTPEMDGFEMLSKIKEKYKIPVVFMTSNKNIETIRKAAELGVEDYLTKPFLPLALKEIMHSISN